MWTIRTEQAQTLRNAALAEFEAAMVTHLHSFNPRLAKVLGDDGLRGVIRFGIDRAKANGFTRRCCVQFFIELIVVLGAEFDTDPQYPWVAEVLEDPSIDDQTERADRLHDRTMEYWDTAIGDDGELAMAALRRVRQEPYEGPPLAAPDFGRQARERIRAIYPEKYDAIGPAAVSALLGRASNEARLNAITSDAGQALLIGLMFTMGHGITRDPHMPWVGNTLTNAAVADPNKRAERLYARSMTYLDAVLSGAA